MANDLSDVVLVQITRETASIDTASFNIPLILATFTNFSERTRTYTSITEVGGDFSSTSNAYKMAQAMFSGDIRPPSIVIGRRQVDSVFGSIATVANNTAYTVTINDNVFSFTSDGTALATEIVTGLKAAFDADPVAGITFTNNMDGTFDVAVSVAGTGWSITSSANILLTNDTPTETWVEALEAVEAENDEWYALTAETHVEADILALAGAIEARRKIYGTSSQDADVPTTATDDIASQLFNLNYDRTFIVYLPTADTQFPECVWIGSQLPETPGSNDWDLKQGSGITVSNLSSTQKVNLRNKSTNFFIRKAGVEVFQDGNMVSGSPIDEQVFIDWVTARLEESVFFRMVNSKKIPLMLAA